MKQNLVIFVCLFGALASALPVSDNQPENIDLVQIPLKDGKELDILTLGEGETSSQLSDRNKRTIGILRDLFPELSKQVEQSVNKVIGQLIRAIGPAVLRTAVQGNSAARSRDSFDSDFPDDDDNDGDSTSSSGGARVQIELPSFDDDEDEDTTSKDDDNNVSSSSGSSTTAEPNYVYNKKVDESASESGILSISLNSDLINRTDAKSDDDDDDSVKGGNNDDIGNNDDANDNDKNNDSSNGDESTDPENNDGMDENESKNSTTEQSEDENINGNSIDIAALNEQLQETIRIARQAEAAPAASDQAANPEENETNSDDQQLSESKAPAIDELTLDSDEPETDDDRNKRFLSLNFGGSGGGGGGSGNFLFDIVRRTADRAARAAGTVYRVVAGTESLNLNNDVPGSETSQRMTTATKVHVERGPGPINNNERTSGPFNDGLFSGSVATQDSDEKANIPLSGGDDGATVGGDGYTEGIPGPVTRLFVLANRGIANLIQDLILRIAQTSERIVNFKARLITSLI